MAREEMRRQMTAVVRRWAASGETQAVFAQRQGVSRAKLRYWLSRVDPASDTSPRFTPVHVSDASALEGGPIEVTLTTGERLIVRAGASPDLIRAVVVALRVPC